jgi:Ras-related protein Rab-6A
MEVNQALFRKIAAALPGMEALSAAKQDDLVDINLKTTASTMQTESRSSGCAC